MPDTGWVGATTWGNNPGFDGSPTAGGLWQGNIATQNILTADDGSVLSTSSTSGSSKSYWRRIAVRDFGLSVPAAATITGVEISMNRYVNSTGGGKVIDAMVSLADLTTITSPSLIGNNKATGLQLPTGGLTVQTWGGPSDLWGTGTTLTPAYVNAGKFGFVTSQTQDISGGSYSIASGAGQWDSAKIKVYYAMPGGSSFLAFFLDSLKDWVRKLRSLPGLQPVFAQFSEVKL